jgi:hypothetical protein
MNIEGLKIFLVGIIGHLKENFSKNALNMYKNTTSFKDLLYPTRAEIESD